MFTEFVCSQDDQEEQPTEGDEAKQKERTGAENLGQADKKKFIDILNKFQSDVTMLCDNLKTDILGTNTAADYSPVFII